MPVPKDRSDAAYFDPSSLNVGDTELFLDLVHAHDSHSTEGMLTAVRSIYPRSIGVATECGMGRTSIRIIDSIFTIARNITAPEGLALTVPSKNLQRPYFTSEWWKKWKRLLVTIKNPAYGPMSSLEGLLPLCGW